MGKHADEAHAAMLARYGRDKVDLAVVLIRARHADRDGLMELLSATVAMLAHAKGIDGDDVIDAATQLYAAAREDALSDMIERPAEGSA